MLRLVVVWWCARLCACGADPMLEALVAGGATRAVVCAGPGAGPGAPGCAAALWSRYWLLARASCLERAPRLAGARVLLYRDPDDCRHFQNGAQQYPETLEALIRMEHPGYSPPDDEWEWLPEHARPAPPLEPFDAALVLLAAPAPAPRAGNHSSTLAIVPQLASWLRYAPAQVPWALEHPPRPEPHALDPAQYWLLDSPLRMLLATTTVPLALLFLLYALMLRWPEPPAPADCQALVDTGFNYV